MKFHPIHIDPTSGIRLPERMNNPFCYEPHPLCIMACKELQEKIAQRDDWREEIDRGKMFGVLIVEKPRKDGEATEPQTGYIAAPWRAIPPTSLSLASWLPFLSVFQ